MTISIVAAATDVIPFVYTFTASYSKAFSFTGKVHTHDSFVNYYSPASLDKLQHWPPICIINMSVMDSIKLRKVLYLHYFASSNIKWSNDFKSNKFNVGLMLPIVTSETKTWRSGAVSYTHLDVYKRQR